MSGVTVFLALVLAVASSSGVSALGRGKMIQYGPDSQYSGYLSEPQVKGRFPALVVIHEWWGLNDSTKLEADSLARIGYVALAIDLFGKTTDDPKEAMEMVSGLDQAKADARMLAGLAYLRELPNVKPAKVGSIGWCFGGSMSLWLATLDPALAAAVAYYGAPFTDPSQIGSIKCPVLLFYGRDDKSIPIDKAEAFDKALTDAGVKHEFYTYVGAGHAFANPTRKETFRRGPAMDARVKTIRFLRKYLKR